MGDFFDNLGKRFTETVDDLGKKAEDTLEVQKLKSNVRTLKRRNERDLIEIGKMVYGKFREGQIDDLEYVPFCEEIEKRDELIRGKEQEISRIQGV
ncbi:hypothetical protein ABXS75_06585 [Roseburia hominis]